jgi:hypothetical protein
MVDSREKIPKKRPRKDIPKAPIVLEARYILSAMRGERGRHRERKKTVDRRMSLYIKPLRFDLSAGLLASGGILHYGSV